MEKIPAKIRRNGSSISYEGFDITILYPYAVNSQQERSSRDIYIRFLCRSLSLFLSLPEKLWVCNAVASEEDDGA